MYKERKMTCGMRFLSLPTTYVHFSHVQAVPTFWQACSAYQANPLECVECCEPECIEDFEAKERAAAESGACLLRGISFCALFLLSVAFWILTKSTPLHLRSSITSNLPHRDSVGQVQVCMLRLLRLDQNVLAYVWQ
jgi:hypothetical protein